MTATSATEATGTATAPSSTGRAARSDDAPPGVFLALAELGLLAAALGTAAGFNRLFIGWGFLSTLAVPLVAAWASALVLRRWRVPVGWAALASLVLGVVVLTWRFAPGTSFLGIPTAESAHALRDAMEGSFGAFRRLVAPVQPEPGFLVVLAAVMWVFGFFADTAALRYRGPVQAVVPYASTFIAAGILARDVGRTGAAIAFVAGIGTYAVTQRALQASERRWVRGEAARGSWAVAAAGASLIAVAVLAGTLIGPRLPGDTEAVVDLRSLGGSGGSRTVVSPFVGIRSFLGSQSDEVLFTVQSPTPAYWRLTSLERYDPARDIWVSRGTYKRAGDQLDATRPPAVTTSPLRQTVRIAALGGLWLPVAFQPVQVAGSTPISYDAGSSSVIVRDGTLQPDATYTVDSEVPGLDATQLGSSSGSDRLDPVYTEDPRLSPAVADLARSVTADAQTPYQQAKALQDYFRSDLFTYDTSVDYRDDVDPVAAFLDRKRGFCQQFASTFALMARSLGLPARVAVGFTPGDAVSRLPSSGGTDQAGFVVRGRHAHAWPEVYFDGVGWVPFEPTTGRGNPQATSYTQVDADQADPPPQQAATTTVPATTAAPTPGAPSTTAPDGSGLDAVQDPVATPTPDDGSGGIGWWAVLASVAALAVAAALLARVLGRRRTRWRRRHDPDGGRIAEAWDDALRWLAVAGVACGADETPVEFARRVARSGVLAGDDADDSDRAGEPDHRDAAAALGSLAWAETVRRFGQGVPDQQVGDDAEAASEVVVQRVRSRTSRRQRVGQLVR